MSEQVAKMVEEVEVETSERCDSVEQVIEAWILKRRGNEHRKRGDRVTFMADGADLASWSGTFGAVIGEWGPVDTIHDLGALREHLGLSPWIAPVEEGQPGTSTTPTEATKQERGEATAELAALREHVSAQAEKVAALEREKADLAAHVERLEVDLHRTRTLLDLSNEVRRAMMEAMHRKEEALRLKREYKQARRAAKRVQEALALAQDGMVKAVYSDGVESASQQWIAVENEG